MQRYTRIRGAAFAGAQLPLPLAVRIGRRCEPLPSGSDADAFVSSVQLARALVTAEVKLRGTTASEALALGQCGDLVVTVVCASGDRPDRTITLRNAVLHAVELDYQQAAMACALLRFVAEAIDETGDPFTAEDAT